MVGPYLVRLLGAQGDTVGNVTFSRFYALHTVLLPPLMMILIGIHIYLVRKHGVAAAVGDTAPKRKFFPEQVFKDTVGVTSASSSCLSWPSSPKFRWNASPIPPTPLISRGPNGISYSCSRS